VGHDATYLELADDLAERLATVGPGRRVVSEHELAAQRGVSRPTARAALQELERRFLVRRVQGVGTFTHRRVDYVISPDVAPSASLTLARAGARFHLHVERVHTTTTADEVVAAALEVAVGEPVVCIVRSTRIDDVLSIIATAHVPAALVPGIAEHATDGVSLYEVMRTVYGLQPVRARSSASLEVPPVRVAQALGVEGRPPMWRLENVNRDAGGGRPTEHTLSWMRADVVRVVFEMGANR
jgi:DNA-binding GntR family transcriptional regulator